MISFGENFKNFEINFTKICEKIKKKLLQLRKIQKNFESILKKLKNFGKGL